MERNWELFDTLTEAIGSNELALSLCKAMSSDEMNDILEYIANCFEIEGGEEE